MLTKKQILDFVKNSRLVHMKNFLIKTISKVTLKDAIIILATRIVPVEFIVDIIIGITFGIKYILVAHFITVLLRYITTFAYTAYALRKAAKK